MSMFLYLNWVNIVLIFIMSAKKEDQKFNQKIMILNKECFKAALKTQDIKEN